MRIINFFSKVIMITAIILLSNYSQAQTIKNGQFIIRGAGNDNGIVSVLSDGNYLYIGATTSYGSGGQDILVVKFAKDFSIIWQKTIGDAGNQSVFDRQLFYENTDGSITILGNTSTGGLGGDDILLVKLDPLGTLLWSKAYGGASNERGISIYKTLDNGYIIGGNTNSYPTGTNNLYLFKTDSLGNVIWNQVIGSTNNTATQISDIVTLSDTSYIFTGIYDGFPSTSNSFIARIDKIGTLQWMKTYTSFSGGSGQEGLFFLKQIGNTLFASGESRSLQQLGGTYDGLLLNLDFDGNVNWAKIYGGTGIDWLFKMENEGGSNLKIACSTTSTFFGGYDMGILEIDTLGAVINFDVFGSSSDENFKYMSNTPEGGIIFSGQTNGFSAVQGDALITKAGPFMNGVCNNQNVSINQSSVSVNPQTITPLVSSNGASSNLSLSSSNVAINIDTLCIASGKGVYGFVYNDLNSNCNQDPSEFGLANRLAVVEPGNIIVQTSSNGRWEIDSLAPNNYTITIDTSGKWETSCLITQNFTVINSDSLTIAPAFGLTSTEPCAEPTVSVHMPFIRRCFTNQKIYVQACNTNLATGILNNAYVDLELDSLITPVSNSASDISFTDLGNNVYRFNIGSLNPGQCFDFWLATDINCAASLGQTLCVDANLLPADSCVFDQIPSPPVGGVQPCTLPWDKSSLSVNGWCQNDSVYFSITNTGSAINGNMQCYSPVRVYVDGILTYIDSVMLNGGETIVFSYPGNGQTWILQADQHPLHPGNSNPNDHVEACGNLSNWTPGLVNTMPLDDADPVIDIYCGLVTGSYDPNDKTGYPLGVGNDHFVSPNGKLDYVIRFQNTGTDTAFTVVVRDTLDVDLDIFSTKSGIASHNYSFKMYGPRILEWTFNNIMLPDSASDQEGSNGFVTFTVLQNPELPNGTVINNRVGIYFDFNDPIITNTTTHTINREVFITTSSQQISKANNFMIIYPNPVSQILNIILDDNQPLNIEIYSVDGKIMHQEKINRNTSINMNKYPAGLYFIKGINEKGDLFQSKFIKN
jgi:uncharacterized repeat protein (TIGR01451 family)